MLLSDTNLRQLCVVDRPDDDSCRLGTSATLIHAETASDTSMPLTSAAPAPDRRPSHPTSPAAPPVIARAYHPGP